MFADFNEPSIGLAFAMAVSIVCAACDSSSSDTSFQIARQFETNERQAIDLKRAVPTPWQTVCVLGPYSDDAKAEQTLGFRWSVESKTSIASSDSMNVLVFVKDKKVIAYTEHTRDKGDFSNLSGQCFARHKASFEFIAKPAIGWPGLFPKPQ